MEKNASAWYGSVLHGDKGAVKIGELSVVSDGAVVASSTVGFGSFIGANAIVEGANVADGVSIGVGSTVASGCDLGAACALAAGSVLSKGTKVPAGQLWAGSPAKFERMLTPEEATGHTNMLQVTAELATLHMDECWK